MTFWQVVINLVFEITPGSSTLEAKKIYDGANYNGSIEFYEFSAENFLKLTVAVAIICYLNLSCSTKV